MADERRRVDLVVERLNNEFKGRARIEAIRWETSYYSAHETFQKQIPEAADCDVVIAIFKARLGTQLPAAFPRSRSGEPYPSGTAYEILSAIEARKAGKGLPDIYVFRYPNAPAVTLDAADRAEVEGQWERLKAFFDTWFHTQSGEFLAAFQPFASTDDFAAKVEDCLRQWLARQGFVVEGPVWDRALLGSPFPGLAAFEADRGSVFFGRDLAIAQAIGRLRDAGAGAGRLPFLLLIGASGSGKSSLLRAGLLPRLTMPGTIPEIDLWRTALVVPGPDPFLSLAEGLFAEAALGATLRQGTFRTRELLAKQLAGDIDTALAPIRDAIDKAASQRRHEAKFEAPRPARLALAIDQAERLFVEARAPVAVAFAALLAALVRDNLAYVVFALRSDAYARFQGSEALVGLREAGATFDLVPPGAGELEEIVTRPVAACRPPLAFEQKDGRSLAALLVADAKGGDVLPLLQITLARLDAAEAGRGDGVLRFADYQGLAAAVTATANEALDMVDGEARSELPALVAGLVTDVAADPLTGAPMPVVAPLDRGSFEAGKPARRALVDAFVGKRLLTADGDGVSQRVRPVHEALLRIWSQAVAIIAETATLIRVRHTLEPIVRDWQAAAKDAKPGHLEISPALLDGARQMATRFGDDLAAPMRDFIVQATAVDAARRDRERLEQERRLRDAEALAAANRRIARRTGIGLVAALGLAILAGWQWRHAEVERDRAEHSLALATNTANGLVFSLAQKFQDVVGMPAATIEDILDRARKLQEQLLGSGEMSPDLRRSQAAALGTTSQTLLKLGRTPGALAAAKQAQNIFRELLKAQPNDIGLLSDLAVSDYEVGKVLVAQGNLTDALKSYQSSLAITQRLASSDPGNTRWQRDISAFEEKVGKVLVAQGNLPDALKSYQAGLAIAQRLFSSDPGNASSHRDLAVWENNVGDVLLAQGNLPEALKSYQASRTISQQLVSSDQGNAEWQSDLLTSSLKVGDVQVTQGILVEALKSYQASLAIAQRLALSDPGNADWQHDLSLVDNAVGDVLVVQGNLTEAVAFYQVGFAIRQRLATSDPGNAGWQRDLTASYQRLGDALVAQGNLAEALKSYQSSLTVTQRLSSSDPGNAGWQRDLLVFDLKVGDVRVAQGNLTDALKAYQASLAIAQRLSSSDPSNVGWRRDLSVSKKKVGDVLGAQGNLTEALASYTAGLAIMQQLTSSDPGNPGWQNDLSAFVEKVGKVLVAQGKLPEALKSYQASLAITLRLTSSNPGNTVWQRDLSMVYAKLAVVEGKMGQVEDERQALEAGRKIIAQLTARYPDQAQWHRDLAWFDAQLAASK